MEYTGAISFVKIATSQTKNKNGKSVATLKNGSRYCNSFDEGD